MNRSDASSLIGLLADFLRDEQGAAAIEFGAVFPVMVAVFLGSVDAGRALWMIRKLNTASQSVADILAREDVIDMDLIDEVVEASRLIMSPFPSDTLGYDIVGIRFDPDDGDPAIEWRETENMSAASGFPGRADGLGGKGEGVIAVTMRAEYRPIFITVFTGPLDFERTAVLRGRQSPFVPFDS
jgi:Flp pilus assembly protein TadG